MQVTWGFLDANQGAVTAIATAVIALATIIYTIYARKQWSEMDRQLNVMRTDQRAWVSVSQKTGTIIAVNAAPSTTIAITNTGKTPALHVVCHVYVEIIPNGSRPNFDSEIVHNIMMSGVIMPGDAEKMTGTRRRYKSFGQGEIEDFPLSAEENEALAEGKAWIALHGTVWYDDVFKVRHWTKFCTHASVKEGMYQDRMCTAYNATDENDGN